MTAAEEGSRESAHHRLLREVVQPGICTGCGACIAMDTTSRSTMVRTRSGPVPTFAPGSSLPPVAWRACPGKGVDYPELYRRHYGRLPDNWLLGHHVSVRTGFANDPDVRRAGASGGITTAVLLHLLGTGRIDAALVVRQGVPTPPEASVVVARTPEEIREAAQSVYIPVSTLDALPHIHPNERYAMTALPDQAAALRWLQQEGFEPALQIRYVLGPYTGTALYPAAIDCLMRSKRVPPGDDIERLEWRAGEWPGHLEIRTASGRTVRSKKVYYNFLIPFFATQASLQSVDFTNEFCDLSVGDAWSPAFESQGGGHSVVVTRSDAMEEVVAEMMAAGQVNLEACEPTKALEMHGHMLDFKKRGSFIRNRFRRLLRRRAPDYGMRPQSLPLSRYAVEIVISAIFTLGRTRLARAAVARIPEALLGPAFNRLRLVWKNVSKPTKRKQLGELAMTVDEPRRGRA